MDWSIKSGEKLPFASTAALGSAYRTHLVHSMAIGSLASSRGTSDDLTESRSMLLLRD